MLTVDWTYSKLHYDKYTVTLRQGTVRTEICQIKKKLNALLNEKNGTMEMRQFQPVEQTKTQTKNKSFENKA